MRMRTNQMRCVLALLCACLFLFTACTSQKELTPENIQRHGYKKTLEEFMTFFSIESDAVEQEQRSKYTVATFREPQEILGRKGILTLTLQEERITGIQYSYEEMVFSSAPQDGYNYYMDLLNWIEKTYGERVTEEAAGKKRPRFQERCPDYEAFAKEYIDPAKPQWDGEYYKVAEDCLIYCGFLTDGVGLSVNLYYSSPLEVLDVEGLMADTSQAA